MSVTVKVDLPFDRIIRDLGGDELGLFMSQNVHKNFFLAMPYLTGAYSTQIEFKPFEYTHIVPYAEDVYTTNKNYRQDVHPFAMANYIEGYGGVAMPKVQEEVQNYINTRIL